MSIQNIQNQPVGTPERVKPQEHVQSQERVQSPESVQSPLSPASLPESTPAPRYDEYVPEEKTERQSIGLYRIEPDEDGSPRAVFDALEDEPKTERCTADTGRVDREIEMLREERKRLEQQLRAANDSDPQKAAELQQKLAALESELAQKDNDAYRRQHTVFS